MYMYVDTHLWKDDDDDDDEDDDDDVDDDDDDGNRIVDSPHSTLLGSGWPRGL